MRSAFLIELDGARRRVLISNEALDDHFGGNHDPDKMAIFEAN